MTANMGFQMQILLSNLFAALEPLQATVLSTERACEDTTSAGDNIKIGQKSSESEIDSVVNSSLPTGIDGHESIHAETGECEASVLTSTDQGNHVEDRSLAGLLFRPSNLSGSTITINDMIDDSSTSICSYSSRPNKPARLVNKSLSKVEYAMSVLRSYDTGDEHVLSRWQSHIAYSDNPDFEIERLLQMMEKLRKMGYCCLEAAVVSPHRSLCEPENSDNADQFRLYMNSHQHEGEDFKKISLNKDRSNNLVDYYCVDASLVCSDKPQCVVEYADNGDRFRPYMKSQGKELTGFKNQSKRRGKNKKGSGSAYGSDNVSLHEHSMESNPKTKTQGFVQLSLPEAHDWRYENTLAERDVALQSAILQSFEQGSCESNVFSGDSCSHQVHENPTCSGINGSMKAISPRSRIMNRQVQKADLSKIAMCNGNRMITKTTGGAEAKLSGQINVAKQVIVSMAENQSEIPPVPATKPIPPPPRDPPPLPP